MTAFLKSATAPPTPGTTMDILHMGANGHLRTTSSVDTRSVSGYSRTKPPVIASYAWTNQGAATAIDDNGILMRAPAVAGDNLRVFDRVVPATPWTIVAMIHSLHITQNFVASGMCLREASSGKVITWQFARNNITFDKYTNVTTLSANYKAATLNCYGPIWLGLTDNGTNIIATIGTHPSAMETFDTRSRTDFMAGGPSHVGYVCNSNNATYGVAQHIISEIQS